MHFGMIDNRTLSMMNNFNNFMNNYNMNNNMNNGNLNMLFMEFWNYMNRMNSENNGNNMPINNIFPFNFSLSPVSNNIIFTENEAQKIERKEGLDIKCDVDRLLQSNHELENKNKDLQTIINYIPFTIIQNEPKKLNDEPGCIICLYDFEIGQKISALPCCHTFHTKCLDDWINRKQYCPICKYEVTLKSILGADFLREKLKKIKEIEELKRQKEKEKEKEEELKRQKEKEEEFKRKKEEEKKRQKEKEEELKRKKEEEFKKIKEEEKKRQKEKKEEIKRKKEEFKRIKEEEKKRKKEKCK